MANLIINGVEYNNVSSVQIPKVGGGVEEFVSGGSSGEYTAADFADPTKPTGNIISDLAITSSNVTPMRWMLAGRTGITGVTLSDATLIPENFLNGATNLASFSAPLATSVWASALANCPALQYIVLPSCAATENSCFATGSGLLAADLGGTPSSGSGFKQQAFNGCSNMNVLILRGSAMWALGNINCFNNTPFASGKAGGMLYVPQSLISTYQADTNWATILGYTNNSIAAIEGSVYATKYADGTPISQ